MGETRGEEAKKVGRAWYLLYKIYIWKVPGRKNLNILSVQRLLVDVSIDVDPEVPTLGC